MYDCYNFQPWYLAGMTVNVSAWTRANLCTERNEGEDDTPKDSGTAWLLLVCMCVCKRWIMKS